MSIFKSVVKEEKFEAKDIRKLVFVGDVCDVEIKGSASNDIKITQESRKQTEESAQFTAEVKEGILTIRECSAPVKVLGIEGGSSVSYDIVVPSEIAELCIDISIGNLSVNDVAFDSLRARISKEGNIGMYGIAPTGAGESEVSTAEGNIKAKLAAGCNKVKVVPEAISGNIEVMENCLAGTALFKAKTTDGNISFT